ncbi:MAG: YqgE/AlgH family protein [Aestuariivita sp.]|nr:YqgE/AlgH family protein [Aestuariivita sp.]MCY4202212.1 YqgE/AlgH family protein [Aestuariivita sp.]MCY4289774.1 YqgE/AlgH family protein [Aestuariivita sp.]MCY4347403.1 YqgE/AlgH family protein [Aestuariivita sp.]
MDLSGQLLVAMPGLNDRYFSRSVVLLCQHSALGSTGLVINKPFKEAMLKELIKAMDIEEKISHDEDCPVYFGGPVESNCVFLLHNSTHGSREDTKFINESLKLSHSVDVLVKIFTSETPSKILLAIGHAVWGPGQLERELTENSWLTVNSSERLVFDLQNGQKWDAAVRSLGIEPDRLSGVGGTA